MFTRSNILAIAVPIISMACVVGCGPRVRTVQPGEGTSPQVSAPLSSSMLRSSANEAAAAAAAHERLRSTPGYEGPDKPRSLTFKPAQDILVTAGPITQPHRILGPVSADTTRIVTVDVGRALAGAVTGTRTTKLPSTPDASRAEMHSRLAQQAQRLYGFGVDAVVNVTYNVDPDGDTFADGIAVEFVSGESDGADTAKPSVHERLRSLKALKDEGLIDEDEFSRKKAEILHEL